MTLQEPSDDSSGRRLLHAANRRQDLRFYFSTEGLAAARRSDTARASFLRMTLAHVGGPGSTPGPAAVVPVASGRSVIYQRDGITELYENASDGLRIHIGGVDLSVDERSEVTLRVSAAPVPPADGVHDQVSFVDHGAQLLNIKLLGARDRAGRSVPARLTVGVDTVSVRFDRRSDSGEPATASPGGEPWAGVDLLVTGPGASVSNPPLESNPAWVVESNQSGANFGWWVDTAGDVNGDGYGDVVVGAWTYDNGQPDEGGAWLYLGSASGPSTTPAWRGEGNQDGARFGFSVATAGDVNSDGYDDLIIGADLFDNGQTDEGAALLYLGSAAGPSPTPSWSTEGNQTGARFGHTVSPGGDINGDGYADAVVTSPNFDNGQTDEGQLFVFAGSAQGLPTSPTWTFDTNQPSSYLHQARTAGDVDGDGYDDLIVGAMFYLNHGKSWVLRGSATGLVTAPLWSAEGSQFTAQFGFWVSSVGDVNGDDFSDVLVISDRFSNGQAQEGAAFVWLGGPGGKIVGGIPGTPINSDWSIEGNQSGAFLRWGGTAGDVNGDGLSDVVLGTALYSSALAQQGRVDVFLGSPTGLELTPAWTALGDQSFARFGWSCATAGDVNGDGTDDIIIGAEFYTNGESNEGRAYVYLGVPPSCRDTDGDGYGSPGSDLCPAGSQTDCDDDDSAVFPGAQEMCDGRDNDCDAETDEGYALGGTCSVGIGACAAAGVMVCDGTGTGTVCSAAPGVPSPETCDGLDNDCDGTVDDNALKVEAIGSISPATLNVTSQGTSFTVSLTLTNVCDPAGRQPIDGRIMGRAYISRAGSAILPDPSSMPCPASDGGILFETGIFDNILARGVTSNGVSLKFNLASDGDCRTLDGDRQDLIALLADALDDSLPVVCVASSVSTTTFEFCTQVTVQNRGNR